MNFFKTKRLVFQSASPEHESLISSVESADERIRAGEENVDAQKLSKFIANIEKRVEESKNPEVKEKFRKKIEELKAKFDALEESENHESVKKLKALFGETKFAIARFDKRFNPVFAFFEKPIKSSKVVAISRRKNKQLKVENVDSSSKLMFVSASTEDKRTGLTLESKEKTDHSREFNRLNHVAHQNLQDARWRLKIISESQNQAQKLEQAQGLTQAILNLQANQKTLIALREKAQDGDLESKINETLLQTQVFLAQLQMQADYSKSAVLVQTAKASKESYLGKLSVWNLIPTIYGKLSQNKYARNVPQLMSSIYLYEKIFGKGHAQTYDEAKHQLYSNVAEKNRRQLLGAQIFAALQEAGVDLKAIKTLGPQKLTVVASQLKINPKQAGFALLEFLDSSQGKLIYLQQQSLLSPKELQRRQQQLAFNKAHEMEQLYGPTGKTFAYPYYMEAVKIAPQSQLAKQILQNINSWGSKFARFQSSAGEICHELANASAVIVPGVGGVLGKALAGSARVVRATTAAKAAWQGLEAGGRVMGNLAKAARILTVSNPAGAKILETAAKARTFEALTFGLSRFLSTVAVSTIRLSLVGAGAETLYKGSGKYITTMLMGIPSLTNAFSRTMTESVAKNLANGLQTEKGQAKLFEAYFNHIRKTYSPEKFKEEIAPQILQNLKQRQVPNPEQTIKDWTKSFYGQSSSSKNLQQLKQVKAPDSELHIKKPIASDSFKAMNEKPFVLVDFTAQIEKLSVASPQFAESIRNFLTNFKNLNPDLFIKNPKTYLDALNQFSHLIGKAQDQVALANREKFLPILGRIFSQLKKSAPSQQMRNLVDSEIAHSMSLSQTFRTFAKSTKTSHRFIKDAESSSLQRTSSLPSGEVSTLKQVMAESFMGTDVLGKAFSIKRDLTTDLQKPVQDIMNFLLGLNKNNPLSNEQVAELLKKVRSAVQRSHSADASQRKMVNEFLSGVLKPLKNAELSPDLHRTIGRISRQIGDTKVGHQVPYNPRETRTFQVRPVASGESLNPNATQTMNAVKFAHPNQFIEGIATKSIVSPKVKKLMDDFRNQIEKRVKESPGLNYSAPMAELNAFIAKVDSVKSWNPQLIAETAQGLKTLLESSRLKVNMEFSGSFGSVMGVLFKNLQNEALRQGVVLEKGLVKSVSTFVQYHKQRGSNYVRHLSLQEVPKSSMFNQFQSEIEQLQKRLAGKTTFRPRELQEFRKFIARITEGVKKLPNGERKGLMKQIKLLPKF
jgi:hypothetical protein